MFWGLIMEPQRRYTQVVKKSFHISMAALDLSTSSTEPAQIMCGFEGRNYLLCTLGKPDMLQCPLDLNFEIGSEVSFAANGKCHVHLTGYLTDDLADLSNEEIEEEQEIEEKVEIKTKKNKKRNKDKLNNGPPNKKLKSSEENSSNQNSDSDESDLGIDALLEGTLDSDDDGSYTFEQEEEDPNAEEDDEEEEEEDSSLSESENEDQESEPSTKSTPKVNGVSKKKDQRTPKQKTKNKQENEDRVKKVVKNGKEVKALNQENKTPKKRTIQGGVIIEDIKEGQGALAKRTQFITVYYEGRLKQNNKMFDSTTKGPGFSFQLGNGEVIKGWDIGIVGMKSGGKRRIICPPAMAYGQKGSPPAIPPNSTLVFEVELKNIL